MGFHSFKDSLGSGFRFENGRSDGKLKAKGVIQLRIPTERTVSYLCYDRVVSKEKGLFGSCVPDAGGIG